MDARLLGYACSVMRVAGVAAVVLTAFARLPAAEFIRFSQFHVGLSIAGFLECAAAIERSRLYIADASGEQERSALLAWSRRAGLICLLAGVGLGVFWLWPAAVAIGAGIACLGLTESAVLRERPEAAARLESAILAALLAVTATSWWFDSLSLAACVTLLALLASAPRLSLSSLMRSSQRPASLSDAARVLKRNFRSIAPFAASQATLPWLFAVPNYAVPRYLAAQEASWVLLGLRASGAVSSMLARTLVQRWVRLVDGQTVRAVPRWPVAALALAAVVAMTVGAAGLASPMTATLFALALSLACAFLAILSTQLNAEGRYLAQVPGFAVFWLTGSAALFAAVTTGMAAPTLANFAAAQLAGTSLALAWLTRLAVHRSGAAASASGGR